MAAKTLPPPVGYQLIAVETVLGFGERQLSLQRGGDHCGIVRIDHHRDAECLKFPKIGPQADSHVAGRAYAETNAAIGQKPKDAGISLSSDAVRNSSRPHHFDGLANDTRSSNLAGMRHETEPGTSSAVDKAQQRRGGDRLITYHADADHPFSVEGDVKRSLICSGGPATHHLDEPRDLDPQVASCCDTAAHDTIDPSVVWMKARVEADLRVADALSSHRRGMLAYHPLEIRAGHHALADLSVNGKEAGEIRILVARRLAKAMLCGKRQRRLPADRAFQVDVQLSQLLLCVVCVTHGNKFVRANPE